jgi:hypothetical protein
LGEEVEKAMQVTLYYNEEDHYLLELVDREAQQERKSRSAVIMSILEEHFERGKKIGEILVDMGRVSPRDVEQALEYQQADGGSRPLGEILVDKGLVNEDVVRRALIVQGRLRRS